MYSRPPGPRPGPVGERPVSAQGAVIPRGPQAGGGTGLVSQIVLAMLCGGYAAGAALGWGSSGVALFMGDFGLSVAASTAAVSCLLYARTLSSRLRGAWYLFALSSAMAALGNAVWGWYEVVLRVPVPSPSFADVFFLCFAPPAIVGLLMLAKRPVSRAGWICLALDTWLIGGSLLTLSWSLALAHTAQFEGKSVAQIALSLAYPLLDIALVSIVLALHFRRTPVNRSAVNTAIGALAVTVVCDALFSSPMLHASYRSGQLLDAGWFAGSLLLAYAPWASLRVHADDPHAHIHPHLLTLPLPHPRAASAVRSPAAPRVPHARAPVAGGGPAGGPGVGSTGPKRPHEGHTYDGHRHTDHTHEGHPHQGHGDGHHGHGDHGHVRHPQGAPSRTEEPPEGRPPRGRPHQDQQNPDRPHPDRPHRPHQERPRQGGPPGDRPQEDRPYQDRPYQDRPGPDGPRQERPRRTLVHTGMHTDPHTHTPPSVPSHAPHAVIHPSHSPQSGPGRYPTRPIAGSLAALAPYLAATVCTLGILYNVLSDRSIDRVVLFTACTVVLALVVRQGIMLIDNISLTQELAQKENHFRSLVQGSSDVIMIAAPNGVLRYVSPAAAGVYGREADELVGTELASLIHPDDLGAVVHEIRRFVAARQADEPTTRIECRFRSGAGQWLNVESTINRHHGGLLFNSRDVTERVRLQAQLQHNAEHDPLTDLPNRALFTRRVGQALGGRRAADRDHGTAVLFIDLDGFKAVNDTIGHQAGDELLVQAARRLQDAVRQGDTAARLGGDEFAALIVGDGSSDQAAREQHIFELADRLRMTLSRPYPIGGNDVRVAASIGVAFAEPGVGEGELLRNADLAMYRAKAAGKGRVELYAPQMQADVVRKAELAGRLRAALHDGEFALLHQPVVNLTTGLIGSVAAHARWRSAQGLLFTPAEFLRVSDDADRTAELGRWMLEEAVAGAADRARAGHPTTVVVRVGAGRLLDRSMPLGSIEALLTRHGLASGALMIELAGSEPAVPLDELERRLTALRRIGVRIGLDGFGSGHAAITALRRLPVDVLKLDRSLVEGVVESARLHKITSGLLRIATDLGLDSVADGVDLPEQVVVLRAMGCTHGQGMAFSAPLDEYRLRRALSTGRFPVPRDVPGEPSRGGNRDQERDGVREPADASREPRALPVALDATGEPVLAGGVHAAYDTLLPTGHDSGYDGRGQGGYEPRGPAAYETRGPAPYPANPSAPYHRGLPRRSHNETQIPPT
ncbi:EAL domain-containing protein [Streptomyces uncialis]